MRSNGLLKWLMLPMAPVVCSSASKLFFRRPWRHRPLPAMAGGQLDGGRDAGAGIEATRPHDTVARWWPRCGSLRTELQTALSDNRKPAGENDRLRGGGFPPKAPAGRSIEQRNPRSPGHRTRSNCVRIANRRSSETATRPRGWLPRLRTQF